MVLESCYDRYQFSDYFKTDLPEHWVEKRLGYLAKEEWAAFVDGPFGSDLKTSDYKDDGVPLIQLNNIRDSKHLMQNMKFVTEDKKQRLIRHLAIPGDVVIAKMADPVARAAAVGNDYSEYVIVADCVKMTANLDLVDLSYLVWAINSDYVRINAELVSTGTTRIRINLGELKKLKIPYPSYVEQQQIANFLDHETAKIDTLIEKQQLLIKLLKEKRQAVISHAVTKGLNPNAPMRDSGVDWLGEVPEHWNVLPLKYVCKLIDGDRSSTYPNENDLVDEGIPFVSSKNIVNYKLTTKNLNYITREKFENLSRGKLIGGDLVITVRGTIGHVGIFDPEIIGCETGFINAQMMIIRPARELTDYLQLLSESSTWQGQLDVAAYGSTVKQLSNEVLGNVIIALPTSKEIPEFIANIKQTCEKFELLILRAQTAIDLMQERRTALISAAVTGKIDVRNWQPQEPLYRPKETHKEDAA